MLIRQRLLVVRGHVQRDEQQLDHISHRPRASSGFSGCSVVGVWVGFLRGRQHRCDFSDFIACIACYVEVQLDVMLLLACLEDGVN